MFPASRVSGDPAWVASLCSTVLKNCNDVIIVADGAGMVVGWNPAAEQVLGWTVAEALQRPLHAVLPLDRLAPEATAAMHSCGSWRGELAVPDRDGHPVTLDVELSQISDGEGAPRGPGSGHLAICRELTSLKHAAQALRDCEVRLRESEERFRSLVEQKQIGVYLIQHNRFRYVNPKFAEIVGYERTELLALSDNMLLVYPADVDYVTERQSQRLRGEIVGPYNFRMQRKTGEVVRVEIYGTLTTYQGGTAIIGTAVDVTERLAAEEALRESEARSRALVDSLSEGVALIDRDLRVITCNESAARLFGLTAQQLCGTVNLVASLQLYRESMAPLHEAERPDLVTLRTGVALNNMVVGVAHPRRHHTWISVNTQPLRRPSEALPYAVVVSLVDITDRKRAEAELHRQAFHDTLTGLPNRALFQDRVERALSQARRSGLLVAVVFVDLDGFKQINDELGHGIGDLFLQQVAQRLSRCLREGDTVARLGGDEFTLLLPALEAVGDAVRVVERVLDVLREPYRIDHHVLGSTASVGISLCPHDGTEVTELLRHADAAMYRVKSAGKDGYVLYTPEINAVATRRLGLEAQLWRALKENQLRLHLLPVVTLATGELRAVEASVRWPHPTAGLCSPDELLAQSEDVELMLALLRWTLRQGCEQALALGQGGAPRVACAVRVPPRVLLRRELCAEVRAALEDSGLPARRLMLGLQLDPAGSEAARLLELAQELHQLGVLLLAGGLWDAGLPLQYLHALPLTAVRLDAKVVQRLDYDKRAVGLCRGVIALGRSLGLWVAAEGVQTPLQLATLRQLDCTFAMGEGVGWPQALAPLGSPPLEVRDGAPRARGS